MANIDSFRRESWAETTCVNCRKKIRQGDPRVVIMLVELGLGPGHPDYEEEEADELGRHCGLMRSSIALSICELCAGARPEIVLPNAWFFDQEAGAADDPGGSVRNIRMSDLNLRGVRNSGDDADVTRYALEDAVISKGASRSADGRLRDEDWRTRVARFLRTPSGLNMRGRIRRVAQLYAESKSQTDIAGSEGITQGQVSKLLQQVKSMTYSSPS
jgi:hypothetical protein